ncbi:serine protease [uncultured Oscillibacter sp.]|uniref:SDH family Clp fold serine proteinase n=1 Tax=uncultured Oscillibacter sp. TaxID=876091 RepID=UPI00280605BB|nr:serine protease [uncultured Oscillibacter sp.]
MAGWDDILDEIKRSPLKNAVDEVRHQYLRRLSELTGRNTIAYYSSWLTRRVENTDINDNDMNGFMNTVRGLDCENGLDLVLHTPGGSPMAAEAIVKYLRSKFGKNIRVIVPHMAMSAGTMIACSAKEIIMGKQSSLGPIDPQLNGIPAYSIQSEFEDAKIDLANGTQNFNYWRLLLSKYPAAYVKMAMDAIALSDTLLREWLGSCMLEDAASETIEKVCNSLNEHVDSKAHARHFDASFCKSIGLHIIDLEADQRLQDAVLSVHHCYVHTFASTAAVKIIENQNGKAFINICRQ